MRPYSVRMRLSSRRSKVTCGTVAGDMSRAFFATARCNDIGSSTIRMRMMSRNSQLASSGNPCFLSKMSRAAQKWSRLNQIGGHLQGRVSVCRLVASSARINKPPSPFPGRHRANRQFPPKTESVFARAQSPVIRACSRCRRETRRHTGRTSRRWRRSARRPSRHRAGICRDDRPADSPRPPRTIPQAAPITSPPSEPAIKPRARSRA